MDDLTAKDLADRTWGGSMSIGRHPLWGVTNDLDGLLEKAPGRFHVSLLTHHRVNQVPIPIDGPIEIPPFPFDVDGGLINVPRPRLFDLVAWHAVGLP